MNPKNDSLAGFCSYLRQHASEYLSISPVSARIAFPAECPPVEMTSEQRRNIFLVVKEALHNVIKHSGAGRVSIDLSYAGGQLHLAIVDDGRGFDAQAAAGKGNGLANMRRRITDLGGVFSLVSGPGCGTRIGITVFLDKTEKHH
jgi:signal transduction histidine kinase